MKQTITVWPMSTSTDPRMIAVSLPAAPWIAGDTLDRDPRHETAPRRGIVSPQETPLERFKAALREVIEDAGA